MKKFCIEFTEENSFKDTKFTDIFSVEDNDDTVASFAYHYKGDVLSGDADFFRYRVGNQRNLYKIFSGYEISPEMRIKLIPHKGPSRYKQRNTEPREILQPLPPTRTDTFFLSDVLPVIRGTTHLLNVYYPTNT